MSERFEWDPRKAWRNHRKHGVSFGEAMTAFEDPHARVFDDPDHSLDEYREILVGCSSFGRLLVVCFTERGAGIRLVSARRATRRERQLHEENLG